VYNFATACVCRVVARIGDVLEQKSAALWKNAIAVALHTSEKFEYTTVFLLVPIITRFEVSVFSRKIVIKELYKNKWANQGYKKIIEVISRRNNNDY